MPTTLALRTVRTLARRAYTQRINGRIQHALETEAQLARLVRDLERQGLGAEASQAEEEGQQDAVHNTDAQ